MLPRLIRQAGAIGVIALALIASATAQTPVYKWRDADGVTHYGDRPPEGSAAAPVPLENRTGTTPDQQVPGGLRPGERAWLDDVERAIAERRDARADVREDAAKPRGMPIGVFRLLHEGMSEARVRHLAGPPDDETIDSVNTDLGLTLKSYYYIDTGHNESITRIRFRNGDVFMIERELNP